MVHSASLDWGDLIQIADPDAMSNPAKQEIEMKMQLNTQEVRIRSTADFETILTIQALEAPADTIGLTFETVFAGAKDPTAKQKSAQFFIKKEDIKNIQAALSVVIAT